MPKCGQVLVGDNVTGLCIPELAKGAQGDMCTPSSRADLEYAYDECGAGYGCSIAQSVCRKYCDEQSDCESGYGCMEISSSLGYGFCERLCSPFDNSTSDCPAGQICRMMDRYSSGYGYYCSPNSGGNATKTDGQTCSNTDECAEGYICSSSRCQPLCNTSNPCPSGRPCQSGICSCRVFSSDCGSGYSCEPTTNGATQCSPIGPLGRDELCGDRGDDCGLNMDCRGSATAKIFACMELCDDNNSCSYGECSSKLSGYDNNLGLCRCTLFDSSSCPSGQFCTFFGTTSSGLGRVCEDYGGLSEGDTCSGSDNGGCGRDLVCWGNDDDGRLCRKMCDDSNSCRRGECTPVTYLPNNAGVCFGS